jgi:GT2 family glycosyltransferase
VLLLNPDAVIDHESISVLLRFMDQCPRVGISAPAVRRVSGELQASGDLPNPLTVALSPLFPRWTMRGNRPIEPGGAPARTNWICGSIMMVRRRMLAEIGVFDPRFFLYFEETDLCYRARRAGWEIWTVGASLGEHANAASAHASRNDMIGDTIPEAYFASRYYYLSKHYGWPAAATAELGELASLAARKLFDVVRGRPNRSLERRLRAPFMRSPDPVA